MVLKKVCNLAVDWLATNVVKTNYQYDAYLVGYYGMKNSGDDALLMASIMGAKNELKMNKLLVSTAHDSLFLGNDVDLNLIHQTPKFKGQNRLKHYQAAMKSRRIIFGGGSVFHTAQDIEMKRQMMKLSGGDSCLAVGVSLGPFVDVAAREECKKFLQECDFIGVRDRQSLELAQQLVPSANVKLTFDLAPLVTLDPSYSSQRQQDKGVLINVCPIPKTAEGTVDLYQQESLLLKMQQMIESVWQQTHAPITLVSLNGHPDLGDDSMCQQLLERCDKSIAVNYLPYHSNPLRMIEQIRNFNVFVSMRLHGCVFGYLANTPVLALTYHTKCQQWCEQIGASSQQRFEALSFNPDLVADTIVRGLKFGFSSPALAVNDAVKLSLLNWRVQA